MTSLSSTASCAVDSVKYSTSPRLFSLIQSLYGSNRHPEQPSAIRQRLSLLRNETALLTVMLLSATLFLLMAVMPARAASLPDFTELVEKTSPAVVNIRTTEKISVAEAAPGAPDEQMQELFRRFFGMPMPKSQPFPSPHNRKSAPPSEEEVPRGVGSGFIVSQDGYVLTNAHVVDGADEVYVKLTDKREFKAKVVGLDKRTDVAVVKIDGTKLPRLVIGDSDKIRAGEWVVAIGSPFDLENSVSAGIVSAKSRDTGDFLPLIQTDVAVNPGNSGGPLLNMQGEVVGINSQIYSRSGGYMGISFAVPIDEAMRVADQLKATGKVSRSRIGIQLSEVPKAVAESFGLVKGQGAFVGMVEPEQPADKAGIVAGDIILDFNGKTVEKWTDLPRIVANTKPGTRASVTLWNKGKTRKVTLVTGEMEQDKVPGKKKPRTEKAPVNVLGLSVSELTEAQKRELKVSGGVLVSYVEGRAAQAGVRPGDVITQLNYSEINNAKEFAAIVAKLDPNKIAVVLIRRGESSQFIPLQPK